MRRSSRRGMGDGTGRVCLHARACASARVPNGPSAAEPQPTPADRSRRAFKMRANRVKVSTQDSKSFHQPLSCSDQTKPFSKQIQEILAGQGSRLLSKLTVRERPGKECFRFWQEGPGFDRNLFSPEAISSSLEHIHNNPVSRGVCRSAAAWKWSSARYDPDVPPRQQHPNLPRIHGLPEGVIS